MYDVIGTERVEGISQCHSERIEESRIKSRSIHAETTMFRFAQHDSAIYEMTFSEYEQSHIVRCDWMDGSRPALGGLRNGFL